MENEQAAHVRRNYLAFFRAKVIVLNIPEDYQYMDDALIWKLDKTMGRWYHGQELLNTAMFSQSGPAV